MKDIIEKIKNIDRKLLTYLGVLLIIIILAIAISSIVNAISNSRKSYSEVESILKTAGKKYYKDNISLLPKEDGGSSSVGDNVLTEEGYMKSLDKLVKNDKCTGKVTVTKEADIYNYSAYLDCGKSYKTQELYKKVIKKTVDSGDGLYENTNGYVFRGENPNNYVKIDNNLWRIVSIDEENNIELVLNSAVEMISWDDRYNSDTKTKSGNNTFENSRLKERLKEIYEGRLLLPDEVGILNESIKDSMINVNNCTDKYKPGDADFTKCTTFNDYPISVISIGEYIKASIDPKCSKPKDAECQNYNYLAKRDAFWTITGNAESTSEVYKIMLQGAIKTEIANTYEDLYPIIKISSKTMYSVGKGTIDNPYIIR